MNGTYTVFVPVAGSLAEKMLARGSGIVAAEPLAPEPGQNHRVVVYFEGDVYEIGQSFPFKVMNAAGRLSTRYPTSALAEFERKDLTEVATYHAAENRIDITDATALEAWAGAVAVADARAGIFEQGRGVLARYRAQ